MKAKVVQEPWMKITHYNSPTIFDGQIGVYDYRWGNTAGYRVVDDQTRGRPAGRDPGQRRRLGNKPPSRTASRSAVWCSSAAAPAPRRSGR